MIESITIACPYCGEHFSSSVDCSAGSQRYIEDCAVCCRPIEIAAIVSDEGELIKLSTTTDGSSGGR